MEKLKKLVKKPKEEEKGEEEEEVKNPKEEKEATNELPSSGSCGFKMKAFVICFILGACCSVTGTCTLYIPGLGLGVFALLFSIGNICCLLSITFLIGPKNQLMSMCAKERALASVLLLVFTGLTLLSAIQWQNSILALVFCILQFLAFLWYTLSYVPYARTGVAKLCSVVCC